MDTDKKIKIIIGLIIVFLPFIYTGKLWGFPNYLSELMLHAFYCSQIICGIIGLYLIYKVFDSKR